MKRLFKKVYWWIGEPKVCAAFVVYAASIFTSHNLGWWECAIDTGASVAQPSVAMDATKSSHELLTMAIRARQVEQQFATVAKERGYEKVSSPTSGQ